MDLKKRSKIAVNTHWKALGVCFHTNWERSVLISIESFVPDLVYGKGRGGGEGEEKALNIDPIASASALTTAGASSPRGIDQQETYELWSRQTIS